MYGLWLKGYKAVDFVDLAYLNKPGLRFVKSSTAPKAYAKGHKFEKVQNTWNSGFGHSPNPGSFIFAREEALVASTKCKHVLTL